MEKIHANMHVFVLTCKFLTSKHKNMHVSINGLLSNSYSPFTRAITTIIDCGKLVARVTVEGAARDLYEGSQLPKVYHGGYSPSDKGSN